MTTHLFRRSARWACFTGLLGLLITLGGPPGHATAGKDDLRIVPIDKKFAGKTYGEWAGEWWSWAVGIPAATNPIIDETGEFGDIDQEGPVWFLAGNFGGVTERTVVVPPGKHLFFPLVNSLWWAPDDVEFAAMVVALLGMDPDDFTDLELISFMANFQVSEVTHLSCVIDGKSVEDPEQFFAESPPFQITDTDLIDDLGAPISEENWAIAAGYWIMLKPLNLGEHTIRFQAEVENALFGDFSLDVSYTVWVIPPGQHNE